MTTHDGNIEIRGKQNRCFPKEAVIKCFVIEHKQNKPQLQNFLDVDQPGNIQFELIYVTSI